MSEMKVHSDWLLGAESSLDKVRGTPLPEHVEPLQQQLSSLQVIHLAKPYGR